MLAFKPKKVFEKLNKMDRKQAYTVGSVAVATLVALIMLITAFTSGDDGSFDGMDIRGFDLATMPFATDSAEQYLLASKYPDMQENGSTLLYSAAEKEERQKEDAQEAEKESTWQEKLASNLEDNTSAARSDNGGYSGYRGGGSSGKGGGTKTEVGKLSPTGVATSAGNALNATAPTGEFLSFRKTGDKGNEAPVALMTGDARRALTQFRQNSRAAATFKDNRLASARKAVMGGNATGSEAINKDGTIDLTKVKEGGLTIDPDAPRSSSDLNNLDKKLEDATKKKPEDKKPEDKTPWWQTMLQDMLKSFVSGIASGIGSGIGDGLKDKISNGIKGKGGSGGGSSSGSGAGSGSGQRVKAEWGSNQ